MTKDKFILTRTKLIAITKRRKPKTTALALTSSIEKWATIVKYLSQGRRITNDGSWDTCALCELHLDINDEHCFGCPVKEESGEQYCKNTPYYECSMEMANGGLTLDSAVKELQYLIRLKKN